MSCVAEKETKCLVISQEELGHKLDEVRATVIVVVLNMFAIVLSNNRFFA